MTSESEPLCDGVFAVDRQGRATLVTPSVAALTGYTVAELVGQPMHELVHHSHADGHGYAPSACPIHAALRDGKTHAAGARAREVFWRKDGSSFPVSFSSTPLVSAGDLVGAVVVFRALERFVVNEDGPQGESAAWRATMELVRRVAPAPSTVLLEGETGTGKELVARAIHELGPRRHRPLVKVNCAALPASLIESELFGHERGAFTGATERRIGRFEQAEDGTLFLDEVGELPLEAQAKLLRVLQERELERVGGSRTLPARARVIAATNRDLGAMVAAGRFRADLRYRLEVVPVRLPPLRARKDDIPLLARHFLARVGARLGRRFDGFAPGSLARLCAHDWPGNVRELENVVERACLFGDGPLVEVAALGPAPVTPAPRSDDPGAIAAALARAGGKITGPRGAAAALGVHPNTLRYRLRKLGLARA